MGSKQSSLAKSNISNPAKTGKDLSGGRRGRKSNQTDVTAQMSTTSLLSGDFEPSTMFEVTSALEYITTLNEESSSIFDTSSDEDVDSEDEDADDHEFEEYLKERCQVFEDARALKTQAEFYLHPEMPVAMDAFATARCFFDRPSAPERLSLEEAEERAMIMQDLKALKQKADDYMHPELPVVTTDPCACGRNYFTRPSAPEQDDPEEANEHAQVLADAKLLKQLADHFMHPEKPVKTTDPFACGRNYFSRPSAPDMEEEEERARILEDAKQLKKLAVDYNHPEIPVVTTDPFACGRNYFSRFSAQEQEGFEQAEERARVFAECKALKQKAIDFMHPELPVVADACAFGRNYFSRYSAPEQMDPEEAEERARILEEAKQLKKLAVDYHHPELPVVTTDPFACGRNYFSRYSAPEQEDVEDAEERARIMENLKALKQLAVDYMHPELPVITTDPFACGRNYFSRYSAPEQEDAVEAEERARIMADLKALKQKAVDYMHPELPVITADPFACGRNYFTRASAPAQEDFEDAEERARIMAEAKQLKKLAVDYSHPELPVITTDPFACARNYFTRASAPQQEDLEEAEERARVLEEAKMLKKLAVDYNHPELPVITTDTFACGRNYFNRYSAPEQMDPEEAEERSRILKEAELLKKLAVRYMHPEFPVVSSCPSLSGRNYFSRYSAAGQAAMVHTFPAHEHDEHHDDHHDHVEPWGFDEDLVFDEVRHYAADQMGNPAGKHEGEQEGNLSRSPSSIMLFAGESIYD